MFKTNMRKALSLILVLCMVFGVAACGNKTEGNTTPTAAPTPAQGNQNNGGDGDTNTTPEAPAEYTYNASLSVFPTNWNPHIYQTATDAVILDYIQSGFYTFDYNETLDGYKIVPDMAVGDPTDVTAEYVGKYGIEAGETARAWKLTLRDDLKWEDGTPIKAQDFVTSAKLLLDPVAQNYRADQLYQGSLAVVGAKDYLYQGQHAYSTLMISTGDSAEYIAKENLIVDENGVFCVAEDKDLVLKLADGGMWSSNSLADYHGHSAYKELFVKDGVDLYTDVLEANADAEGNVQVTEEVYEALLYIVARMHDQPNVEAYAEAAGDYAYLEWQEFLYIGETYPEFAFENVGVFTTAENELVLVLEKPLEGFYLLYNFTGSWLVNEELYKKCETIKDGVYNNTYGTSAETTMSYGPYKLASFQADKEFILEKNENFHGLTEDTYQTTKINFAYVAEAATRLELFLSGKLDTYDLSAEDMETYQSSDNTYYTNGPSTFFVAMNPALKPLEAEQEKLGPNYNKTILTVKEFRQGLSAALDRSAFNLAADPTTSPAYGVFSGLIISDPETGTAYRTNEEAKWVLANFWGLSDDIGAGKMYETVDDAVESITGYNLEMGKNYFNQAYDIAIAEGLMDEDDIIQIKVGTPNGTANFYNKGYEFLVNCYTEAVKGTKLEGKLEFTRDDTLGNGFGAALRENRVDMLFGVGWSGSALDPYGLIEAYTSKDYQYDPSWDTTQEMITIELDGVKYTASVWDWTLALAGTEITITAEDGTTKTYKAGSSDNVGRQRFEILVALEAAVLSTYDLLPLSDEADANLKGMQFEYYTEDYIYGVGRGGMKYYTYNYTDAEWEEFVASQGGKLNYN